MNPQPFPIGQVVYVATLAGLIVFALAAIAQALPKIIKARRGWAELLITRLTERRLALTYNEVAETWLVCRPVKVGSKWTLEPIGDGRQWQIAAHNALCNIAALEGKSPTAWQQR